MVQQLNTCPFYLVFDVSWSMETVMPALNDCLRILKNEICADPLLADVARVSLITFSEKATVKIPMTNLAYDNTIGAADFLSCENGTSFEAAFTALKNQIEADIRAIKAEKPNDSVQRPLVFFVTDGDPLSDSETAWRAAFDALTSAPIYPNIVPLGFGDVLEENLASIVWPKKRSETFYFIAKNGVGTPEAMKAIGQVVAQSVVSTGSSVRDGAPEVIIEDAGTQGALKKGFVADTVA
ncbi:vWA domain-containing protein [Gordonia aquimaris]|uniref:VWA domain-containing protein n=1 Tax=Gordonia aquimaris TaxID=2984863 RepID=A0A9X3I6C9_9ACTN|nr:VWA domain-containing protein [Gordonia aquimaris]MCX2965399.1 VWA domain-containing protein [Gordonia aquimaris]